MLKENKNIYASLLESKKEEVINFILDLDNELNDFNITEFDLQMINKSCESKYVFILKDGTLYTKECDISNDNDILEETDNDKSLFLYQVYKTGRIADNDLDKITLEYFESIENSGVCYLEHEIKDEKTLAEFKQFCKNNDCGESIDTLKEFSEEEYQKVFDNSKSYLLNSRIGYIPLEKNEVVGLIEYAIEELKK
jgi:hypothetical protein